MYQLKKKNVRFIKYRKKKKKMILPEPEVNSSTHLQKQKTVIVLFYILKNSGILKYEIKQRLFKDL
jgi:hypothetical protein